MIVYARKVKTYIWADNNGTHKAGWVPRGTPLYTSGEHPRGWYGLNERPLELSLPPDPLYPDYWAKVGDTIPDIAPVPEPLGGPTDADVAAAVVVLLRWFRNLL